MKKANPSRKDQPLKYGTYAKNLKNGVQNKIAEEFYFIMHSYANSPNTDYCVH